MQVRRRGEQATKSQLRAGSLRWRTEGSRTRSPLRDEVPGLANMEVIMRAGSVILIVWLIIGIIAAVQRGYFGASAPSW